MKNIGDGVVKEARVMGYNDGGAVFEASQVVLQPGNVDDVQVVSGFIKQENVGLEEHGSSKSKFHLPTTRETADGVALTPVRESDRGKGLDDLILGDLDSLVIQDELKN